MSSSTEISGDRQPHILMDLRYDREIPEVCFTPMIQVAISPASLLDEAVCVEEVEGLRLFKFTETLQVRLEELLEANESNSLSEEEDVELTSLNELDRLFTYLNARLLAPT